MYWKTVVHLKYYGLHWIRAYLRCGEPEGRKPSALYQNPGSMHFNVFLTSIEKRLTFYNIMFSLELELIPNVANPKGGNRALRVRIRRRCILIVFLTSNEKLVSYKMLCFQCYWGLFPLWRTRREETERCESESGVDVFLTFSWHLMNKWFLCCVFN